MKSSKSKRFTTSSKLLHKKWIDDSYLKHREKLLTVKPTLSHDLTKVYPHMNLNMKKMQKEEERQAEVDNSNKILMQRLTRILNEGSRIDSKNDAYTGFKNKSLRYGYNQYLHQKILNENYHIVRRLNGIKSHYGSEKMARNFSNNRYLLHLMNDTTKSYEDQSPFTDRHTQMKGRSQKQPVFGSDVLPPCNSIGKSGDANHSPFSEDTFISNSELLSSRRDNKDYRKLYRSQDECSDDKESQPESYAKLLKKLLDGLAQPNELLARCLAKRKQRTRRQIADKFKDLYGLDLATELKNYLSKDYSPFVEVMLEEDIESSRVNNLHQAIKNIDTETVLNILLSSTPNGISQIEKKYQKEFSVTVQEDIDNFYPGNICTYIFSALLEGLRHPSMTDDKTARVDCDEIHDREGENLLGAQGLIASILADDGPNQLKLTALYYKENYGSLSELVKARLNPLKDRTAEFLILHLIDSLIHDKFLDKHLISLKQGISPVNKDFIRHLALHIEDDDLLPTLRSYKSTYHVDLMDEIGDRCRENSAPILQAMVDYRFQKTDSHPSSKTHSSTQDKGKFSNKSKSVSGAATPSTSSTSPFKVPAMRTYAETVHQRKLATKIPKNPMVTLVDSPEASSQVTQPKTSRKSESKRVPIVPSIVAKGRESLEEDCAVIHDSLLGFGHSDINIIDRLTDRNGLQRQNIMDKYFDLYQEDLLEELKKSSPEEFHVLYTSLLKPTQESLLVAIEKGIKKSSDNDFDYLTMGLLLDLNKTRLNECSKKYHIYLDKHLDDDLTASGDVGRLVRHILQNVEKKAEPSEKVDALIDKIVKIKKPIHINDDIMLEIFNLSREQIKPLLTELSSTQRKKSLEEFIQSKFTKPTVPIVTNIMRAIEDPILFIAEQLHSRLSQVDILSPAIVYLSEMNLQSIKMVYEQQFSITLEANIERHVSAPLRTYLIRLVRGNNDA